MLFFSGLTSVPGHPKFGTTGQRSGQRQPGVAWPARLTHPIKPAWLAGWLRPLAGQPPSRPASWLQLGIGLASCWLAVGLFGPLAGDACWPASWPGGVVTWPGPSRGGPVGRLTRDVGGWLAGWLEGELAGLAGALCVWLACWLAGWLAGGLAGSMWLHGHMAGLDEASLIAAWRRHCSAMARFLAEEDHKVEACFWPKFRTEK